jgi:hypothetical protein
MKYDFQCDSCSSLETVDISPQDFDTVRSEGIPCDCGKTKAYKFTTDDVSFCFRGDAWSDKNYREKEYRKRRSAYMDQRMKTNHKKPTLVPNYKGETAQTWEEVRDAAAADGKNTLTYEPLIRRERNQ